MHGEKEKSTYTGKNKQEKAGFLSHDITCHCQHVYKHFLCYTVVKICLTKNIERKKNERIQGRTSRRRLIHSPTI